MIVSYNLQKTPYVVTGRITCSMTGMQNRCGTVKVRSVDTECAPVQSSLFTIRFSVRLIIEWTGLK